MQVAIIIVNFNNPKDTIECLESINKIKTSHDCTCYVVDYGGKLANKIMKVSSDFHSIPTNENLGFSGLNNLGIKEALKNNSQYIVLLNNDTIVDKHFLDPLIKDLKDPKIAFSSPKIYFYPGKEFHLHDYAKSDHGNVIWYAGGIIDWNNMYASHWGVDEIDLGQHNKSFNTQFATGCCLAISAKTIKKIGLLKENYFLYWEDVEWSKRATSKGYSIKYEPNSKIWHKNASSSGGSGSKMHQYYQTRNRLAFGLKHAPLRSKLSLLKEAYNNIRSQSETRKPSIDALLRRMGKQYD